MFSLLIINTALAGSVAGRFSIKVSTKALDLTPHVKNHHHQNSTPPRPPTISRMYYAPSGSTSLSSYPTPKISCNTTASEILYLIFYPLSESRHPQVWSEPRPQQPPTASKSQRKTTPSSSTPNERRTASRAFRSRAASGSRLFPS